MHELTWVEEHVPDRSRLLVDLDGVTGEDDALGVDALRVGVEEGTAGDEDGSWKGEEGDERICSLE